MKAPTDGHKIHKLRPYWHVDAKWICAILLGFALVFTLPVAAAYRLTEKNKASDVVAYSLAGLTSPQGIDADAGIADLKARVLADGSETVSIGGVDVTFTAADFESLSPRELRLKVFKTFADSFYQQGATQLAQNQGLDPEAVKNFENDATVVSLFSKSAHQTLGAVLIGWLIIDAVLLAGVVLFSRRFGRLVSPALVFLVAGLPGVAFGVLAARYSVVSGTARPDTVASNVETMSNFVKYSLPVVMPTIASVYLLLLKIGGILLLIALIGRVVYAFLPSQRHPTEPSVDAKNSAEQSTKPQA